MRTGLTNNRNVLTATTHRSTATPVYLQYPKYVAGVEHALHMAYKHLICKCKNSFAFTDFQFANLVAIFTNVCYNVTMYFDKGDFPICASAITSSGRYFTTSMKERAGGTATPIINRGLWDSLLIPLPPLAEQRRIVAKLEEILPLCERLK